MAMGHKYAKYLFETKGAARAVVDEGMPKAAGKQQSKTYERFYGTRNDLKRNLVKPARRLRIQ